MVFTSLLINTIVVLHLVIIVLVLYGWIGVWTGRFLRFHRKDTFVYVFFTCGFGQVISEAITGRCVLTDLEKSLRYSYSPSTAFDATFLQHYFPFLPQPFIDAVGMITLACMIVALVQVGISVRRSQSPE